MFQIGFAGKESFLETVSLKRAFAEELRVRAEELREKELMKNYINAQAASLEAQSQEIKEFKRMDIFRTILEPNHTRPIVIALIEEVEFPDFLLNGYRRDRSSLDPSHPSSSKSTIADPKKKNLSTFRRSNAANKKIDVRRLTLHEEEIVAIVKERLFQNDSEAMTNFLAEEIIALKHFRAVLHFVFEKSLRKIDEVTQLQPLFKIYYEGMVIRINLRNNKLFALTHANQFILEGELEGQTYSGRTDFVLYDDVNTEAKSEYCLASVIFELKIPFDLLRLGGSAAQPKDQLIGEMELLLQQREKELQRGNSVDDSAVIFGGLTDMFAISMAIGLQVEDRNVYLLEERVVDEKSYILRLLFQLCIRRFDELPDSLTHGSLSSLPVILAEEDVDPAPLADESGNAEASANISTARENDENSFAGVNQGNALNRSCASLLGNQYRKGVDHGYEHRRPYGLLELTEYNLSFLG